MTDWCILRTSGGRTLKLADWLAAAGYEAWTPREAIKRRKSGSKVEVQFVVPILPTYVFVPEVHLLSLFALIADPTSRHPRFSMFRYAGRSPTIRASAMEALRRAESKADDKRKAGIPNKVAVGSDVHMTVGAFGGLTGVVVDSTTKKTWVQLSPFMRLEIASWKLLPGGVGHVLPSEGAAA